MLHSATFVIPSPQGRTTTVARLISPPGVTANDFGTLMFLGSLTGKLKIREQIMDGLTTAFFKSATETRQERIILDDHFERVVRAVNDEIVRQVATHGKEWLINLHLLVAILRPPELVFSLRGTIRPLLIQRERIYNLLELGNRVPDGPPNPFRFLSTLQSGRLEDEATLTFLSESILDYLSLERVRRTVQQPNPIDAASQLQSLLPKNGVQPFVGIIIRFAPSPRSHTQEKSMAIAPPLETTKSRLVLGTHRVSAPMPKPSQIRNFLGNVTPHVRNFKFRISNLKSRGVRIRIGLGIAALLVLTFLHSLVVIGKWRDYSANMTKRRVVYVTVETIISEAEGALLYNDSKLAQSRLDEAIVKLAILTPRDQSKLQSRIEEIKKKLDELAAQKQKSTQPKR